MKIRVCTMFLTVNDTCLYMYDYHSSMHGCVFNRPLVIFPLPLACTEPLSGHGIFTMCVRDNFSKNEMLKECLHYFFQLLAFPKVVMFFAS